MLLSIHRDAAQYKPKMLLVLLGVVLKWIQMSWFFTVHSNKLEMCKSTLGKILQKDLSLRAYKVQLVLEMKPLDHHKYLNFDECAENKIQRDPAFFQKVRFHSVARLIFGKRLWWYFKSQVLAEEPYTLNDWELKIRDVIAQMHSIRFIPINVVPW